MPRARSSGPSRSAAPAARSRPAPSPAAAPASSQSQYSAPPPAPAAGSAPLPAVPQSGGGGIMSGLMGTVVTGAALGTGSALGHRAVDYMFSGGDKEAAPAAEAAPAPAAPMSYAAPPAEGACAQQVKGFAECMSRNNGDMGACQFYFDMMQQCKTSA